MENMVTEHFGSMDNDNIANTHNVDFEVFIKCMTNEKLGTDAFTYTVS